MNIALALALSIIFACLMLHPPAGLASAEQVSIGLQPKGNGVQASQVSSIQLTLSDQVPTAIHLEARQAPLGQILKEITAKTGAIIHYSVLPEAPAGANIWQLMDCLVAKQVGMVTNKSEPGKMEKGRDAPQPICRAQ
jgi:hypothetical protein